MPKKELLYHPHFPYPLFSSCFYFFYSYILLYSSSLLFPFIPILIPDFLHVPHHVYLLFLWHLLLFRDFLLYSSFFFIIFLFFIGILLIKNPLKLEEYTVCNTKKPFSPRASASASSFLFFLVNSYFFMFILHDYILLGLK